MQVGAVYGENHIYVKEDETGEMSSLSDRSVRNQLHGPDENRHTYSY